MSGTGKSSVLAALRDQGYRAVDADDGYTERQADGSFLLREEAVRALLDDGDDPLIFAACEENQGRFYPRFDHVVLLTAPPATILERLRTRTGNPWGRTPEEQALVMREAETVEPLLRRSASLEIDTRAPLDQVVRQIVALMRR
jgi:dephospho-CoA kinase